MIFIVRGLGVCLLLFCAAIISAPAWADDEKLPDRFMLRFGGYTVQNADTIARLDANNLPVGVYVDFNETLGVESKTTVGRLDGRYRFNDQHSLGLAWYALNFTGARTLSKTIEWGDLPPLTVGTYVESEIKFDVIKANYQYSLFHSDQAEIGVLIGFHVLRTAVGLNASMIGESKGSAVTAPLPVLGLFTTYHFTPRTSVYYNYQVFSINYDDKAKGGLQDFLLGLEYRLFRNVALGAAYNKFALDLELVDENATLYVNTGWNGGMLYGSLYF